MLGCAHAFERYVTVTVMVLWNILGRGGSRVDELVEGGNVSDPNMHV